MIHAAAISLRFRSTAISLGALAALVACRVGPQPPGELIEPPGVGTSEVRQMWEAALDVEGGQVKLVLTEQQLSAYLTSRLAETERPVIDLASIYLRDGEISIYGVAELGPLDAGALIVVEPVLDAAGSLAFAVTSAELGPFPAPKTMLEALSDLLTEAFTGKLGPLATGIRITSLAIADGQVAIVGSLR